MHLKNYKPRLWQDRAMNRVEKAYEEEKHAMIEACPGAGKTFFSLAMSVQMLKGSAKPFLVIVVPGDGLRRQWGNQAAMFGLNLICDYDFSSPLPNDCHGIVHTYQAIANNAMRVRHMLRYGGMVIFDEIHHCAEKFGSWGPALIDAFGGIDHPKFYTLALTGTPFRTDQGKIPFVPYFPDSEEDGSYLCSPHDSYSYGDALDDTFRLYNEDKFDEGIIRPIFFPNYDGVVEYMYQGETYLVRPGDEKSEDNSNTYLAKTHPDSEVMSKMLQDASKKLTEIRSEGHSNAGGLVVARDKQHAEQLAIRLREIEGGHPLIVHSEIDGAGDLIEAFDNSDRRWIIAVKMVAEGVDIKRLRVGVYASNIKTKMWLIQVIGRVLRWQQGLGSNRQLAYFYFVEDPDFKPVIDNYRAQVEAVALDVTDEDDEDNVDWPGQIGDGASIDTIVLDTSIVLTDSEHTKTNYIYDGRYYTQAQVDHATEFRRENNIQASIPDILKMMSIMGQLPGEELESQSGSPARTSYAKQRTRMRKDVWKLMRKLSHKMWATSKGRSTILSLFPTAESEKEGRFRAMYKLHRLEESAPYVPAKQMSIEELEAMAKWAQKRLAGINE